MTDEIKTLQEKYYKVSNQIEYQFEMFNLESSITKKHQIIQEIKIILKTLEENMKMIETEYNISPSFTKSEYKIKSQLKRNFQTIKKFKNELVKCEEILNTISISGEFQTKKHNLENLGATLDYSVINSTKTNANVTYKETKNFILNLEKELKTAPLIDKHDPAYNHYLNYNQTKQEIKLNKKKNMIRLSICIIIVVGLVLALLYIIIYKTGGDKIIIEPEQ